jgi:hypothetical protein
MAGLVVKPPICDVERTFVIPTEVEESLNISVVVKTVRDLSQPSHKATARQATSLGMTETAGDAPALQFGRGAVQRWTLSVERWTFASKWAD